MKVGDLNLADPGVFLSGVPYEYFALLRREAPVVWEPRGPVDGFWSITRYADIQAIEKNVSGFTSRANIVPLPLPEETLLRDIDHNLVLSDPPRQQFLRRVIMSAFTPKALSRLNERIKQLAIEAVDAVIERGDCDLVDLAAYVPIEVVADMLGIPEADRPLMFAWSNATFGMTDPEFATVVDAREAAHEMFEYARRLGLERRANPGDDIFSTIAAAREDGEMLSDVDLGCFFLLLVTAGNETTRTQILNGTHALIQHPQAHDRLKADRALLPNAIEEMLRWGTPALCFGRKATQDVELHGQLIKAGQQVILWYCSASRDETVFDDPESFRIDRANAREHLAFGAKGAIHHCLGSTLAKAELLAVFDQMLTRMPDIELAAPISRLRSNFTNGIKRMPVKFTPGAALGDAQRARMYSSGFDARFASGASQGGLQPGSA